MNFNKCSRCGGFFISEGNTCPNCLPKDQLEINKLENFIAENTTSNLSIDDVIYSTGISNKNLNRYLMQNQFSDFASQLHQNNFSV